MIPRINVGKSVTAAVRKVIGEGRDCTTGALKKLTGGRQSRVDWIGGTGFGFPIDSPADADLARRLMEFDALNQTSPTKQCEQDCVHLSLSWARGETPSREQMEASARGALDALGMSNAKALFVAHNDKSFACLHIVGSKLNPDTGRAYDLKRSWWTLGNWARRYDAGEP